MHFDFESTESPGFSHDQASVLLGTTYNEDRSAIRFWWPTPTELLENDFFAGEWTTTHEAWFRQRLRAIEGDRWPPAYDSQTVVNRSASITI